MASANVDTLLESAKMSIVADTFDDDDDDVCMYDGGSYDDPKIEWLEADPFKWSVIIDLV